MASSRKAKPLKAPVPPRPGVWARFLAPFEKKPLETVGGLGAIATALGAAVTGLGFITLRAREALLGLSPGLAYPKEEWLFTGFNALGALLWRGLSVLASDHPVLQGSAWALLLLLVGILLAGRSFRRPALLLAVLTVSALLLFVGVSLYRKGFDCGKALSANLSNQIAFETCSWLENDTPKNDGRRSDLGGLLGWLLAACVTAAVTGARAPVAGRRLSRLRWALVGAHALLGLLLVYDLPRAHAFSTWGLRYPQVRLQESCGPELAQATAGGSCWAFDVSAGAEKRAVYLKGSGCPEGRDGTFLHLGTASTDGSECLATLSSPPRVILYGPN